MSSPSKTRREVDIFELEDAGLYNAFIVQLVLGDVVMTTKTGSRGRCIVSKEISRAAQIKEARAAQVTGAVNGLPGYNDMKHDNYANYVDNVYSRYSDGH